MNRARQADIIPEDKLRELGVTIIGAGAVGSFTATNLAKMGIGNLTVYDNDEVEEHNLSNQWFGLRDVGRMKVDAVKDAIVLLVDDVQVAAQGKLYEGEHLRSDIVICCVDNMESRHYIYRRVERYRPKLYIDSRMGARISQVFSIFDGENEGYKANRLFPPEEAEEERCTAKSTIYGAAGTAAMICSVVNRYILGEPIDESWTQDWVTGASILEAA